MTTTGADIEVFPAAAARLERLRLAMAGQGLDGLLVSAVHDIRYLSGFVGDDSLVLVDGEGLLIISDTRYDEQLEPWRGRPGTLVEMGTRHRLEATVARLCGERSLGRLGVQAEHLSVAGRRMLAESLAEAGLAVEMLVDTEGLVQKLRQRKDEAEVAAIEAALRVQEQAFTAALKHLRLGMSELEFAARIEFEMKSRGASGSSFAPIVGTGANSSRIHHECTTTPIGAGPLLIDWGAVSGYYCSDLTRTVGVGGMPERIRSIYAIVLEAQQAALEACGPGRICAEIDAVARSVIERAGYGPQFGHGLGHGLGLQVHESPYFNRLETGTVLEPGMVMTVEPGIYLPGVGGVRIEDDVLITDDGARVLSDLPRDLETAIVEPQVRAGAAR